MSRKKLSIESLEIRTMLTTVGDLPDVLPPPGCHTDVAGDADCNGVFDSADLVKIMQSAEYEDDIPENSTWGDGDFDGDGEFSSEDLVLALQFGNYESDNTSRRSWDLDRNGSFGSGDLVILGIHGRYEDYERGADPDMGDFDGDGFFTSDDLVLAMQNDVYVG